MPLSIARKTVLGVSAASVFVTLTLGALSPVVAAEAGQTGQFYGQSDHITTGTVTIEDVDGATYVVLGDDFSLDGAPSPTLGFSVNGEFVQASEFAELNALTGEQRYKVPASLDISAFDAFVVWCSQFSIPLGSANLG
jgi:hypothetical protein